MFGYYSTPSSHFGQHYPSRSTHYYPSPSPSSSRSSCSTQYHRHPFASRSAYYINDDDGDETPSSSASSYYEYLDAARREQERRELLEAQARRRVQEERAIQYARAEAQLRTAVARARQEEQERQQEREYREYMERQLEARREAQLARAIQIQRERERERQEEQEEQLTQRKIRQLHQQQKQQEQERLRQAHHPRQLPASFDGEDLARAIFGQLGWHPVAQSPQRTQQQEARSPSTVSAQPAVHIQPIKSIPTQTQQPAVQPLPPSSASATPTGQTQSANQQQQPKMSYMAAVNVIQGLAKEQIDLRQRLRALHSLREQFSSLKSSFVLPQSLIFDTTKSTTEAPVLAYTPQNRPLQAYEEALTRILTQLDAIPSQGSERIKIARKEIAREVQAELDALDREKIEQWKKQQTAAEAVSSVETESVAVPVAEEEEERMALAHDAQDGSAPQAAVSQDEDSMNEAVGAQEDHGEVIVDAPARVEAQTADQSSSHGDEAKEQHTAPDEADKSTIQMDTDDPTDALEVSGTATVEHNEIETPSSSSSDTSEAAPTALDRSHDLSASSDPLQTDSEDAEVTFPASTPSFGETASPSFTSPAAVPEPNALLPFAEVEAEEATEHPSISSDPTTDSSSAPAEEPISSSTSLPERHEPTPSERADSSQSVSATLLPTSHGGLGMVEILPESSADSGEEERDASDTGSDTSFEML